MNFEYEISADEYVAGPVAYYLATRGRRRFIQFGLFWAAVIGLGPEDSSYNCGIRQDWAVLIACRPWVPILIVFPNRNVLSHLAASLL